LKFLARYIGSAWSNASGNYCLKVTPVTSHYLYYSMCSKCFSLARAQARRRWRLSPTARSATWLSGLVAVDASF